ncbi:MAG: phosphate transport system protein [Halothiobacillaceae bacterium]|nr:MAG: phosphate transport system protein [Halothiobacillaceae bacterium]
MDKSHIGQHISKQFNSELEDVLNRVLTMGGLVEQQLDDALKALTEGDATLGALVTTRDYQINALEVAIDEECTQIIARRQPTASDLRLIMAIIKTIADLERIGDEAERIGRLAVAFAEAEGNKKHFIGIEQMGQQVSDMLHRTLDAYARMDTEAAAKVWREDSKVDAQYENTTRQLITYMMEDPRSIPWVLDIMWSARALERMGDRVRNICEYIIYFVKGKDVRHTSLDTIEQEAKNS